MDVSGVGESWLGIDVEQVDSQRASSRGWLINSSVTMLVQVISGPASITTFPADFRGSGQSFEA